MNRFIFIIGTIQLLASCHRPCNEPDYNFSVTESPGNPTNGNLNALLTSYGF